MAKRNFGLRIVATFMALLLCFGMLPLQTLAASGDSKNGKGPHHTQNGTEYIEIYVNGVLVKTFSGEKGDDTWLIRGTYDYDLELDKDTLVLTYQIGNQSGTYTIPMPAGYEDYEIGEVDMTVTFNEDDSTNTEADSFDNAKIEITIKTVIDPETEEEIVLPEPEPTEPEPTEPEPTEPEPIEPEPTQPEPTRPEPTKPDPTHTYHTTPPPNCPYATSPSPTN